MNKYIHILYDGNPTLMSISADSKHMDAIFKELCALISVYKGSTLPNNTHTPSDGMVTTTYVINANNTSTLIDITKISHMILDTEQWSSS